MLATEILGSVLMAEVRCASAPAVVHAPPPRPCAWAVPAATSTPRNIALLRRHTTFISWKLLRGRRPEPDHSYRPSTVLPRWNAECKAVIMESRGPRQARRCGIVV